MGYITRNDLTPGRKFVVKWGEEVYKVSILARENVIYEDKLGKELTCAVAWALENFIPYEVPVEGTVWYCPTCHNFYKKIYNSPFKTCQNDGSKMVEAYVKEVEKAKK